MGTNHCGHRGDGGQTVLVGDDMHGSPYRAPLAALFGLAAAMPAAAGDWTQFYIGGGLGADVLTGQGRIDDGSGDVISGEAPIGGDLGLSLTAGADYQLNSHFLVGAFATYDWSNIDTHASITDGFDTVSANLLKVDQSWTVGARIGVLATPSSLIYALLGYSWLDVDDISVTAFGLSQSIALPDPKGWTIGAGFEHKLNQKVSLRGEYRYTDFGDEVLSAGAGIGSITADSQNHTARLVAAYRFGGTGHDTDADAAGNTHNWTGAYFGGGVGVDAFVRDLDVSVPIVGITGDLSGLGGGGFAGNLIAGYDVMLTPRVLAGVFGSYDWSTTEFTVSASVLGDDFSAEFLSLDKSWTAGARAGLVLSNDVLLYGLIGYTHVMLNDTTLSGVGSSVTLNFPSLDGVTFGGAFEKFITDTLSLRAEYRYTALENASIPVIAGVADMNIDSSMHSAKLILTYRFAAGISARRCR